MLKTSALQIPHGGNPILLNLFDKTKFSYYFTDFDQTEFFYFPHTKKEMARIT